MGKLFTTRSSYLSLLALLSILGPFTGNTGFYGFLGFLGFFAAQILTYALSLVYFENRGI